MSCNKKRPKTAKKTAYVYQEKNDIRITWSSKAIDPKDPDQERRPTKQKAVSSLRIADYITKNSQLVLDTYANWIYSLGTKKTKDNTSIRKLLEIEPGVSLWWSLRITEGTNLQRGSTFNKALILVAIHHLFLNSKTEIVCDLLEDDKLSESLRVLCRLHQLDYRHISSKPSIATDKRLLIIFKKQSDISSKLLRKLIYRLSFTGYFYAVIWLVRQYIKTYPLRKRQPTNEVSHLLFVDYLHYFDVSKAAESEYDSDYWNRLPSILNANSHKIDFAHRFINTEQLSWSQAKKVINSLNHQPKEYRQNHHKLLDDCVGIGALLQCIIQLTRLCWKRKETLQLLSNNATFCYLTTLLKEEIIDSFSSRNLGSTLLIASNIKSFLKLNSKYKKVVYLQENMAWESLLIQYIRQSMPGCEIIGYPHATVRRFDLRNIHHQREYCLSILPRPYPDIIVSTGDLNKSVLETTNNSPAFIVDAEALRYINQIQPDLIHKSRSSSLIHPKVLKVLLLTDYDQDANKCLFRDLDEALKKNQSSLAVDILIKEHSLVRSHANIRNVRSTTQVNSKIQELALRVDAIISTDYTSAAIDAYLTGKPLLLYCGASYFNNSPALGLTGLSSAFNSDQIIRFLASLPIQIEDRTNAKQIFNLDPTLNLWQHLLVAQ